LAATVSVLAATVSVLAALAEVLTASFKVPVATVRVPGHGHGSSGHGQSSLALVSFSTFFFSLGLRFAAVCHGQGFGGHGPLHALRPTVCVSSLTLMRVTRHRLKWEDEQALVERRYRWRSSVSILYTGGRYTLARLNCRLITKGSLSMTMTNL
jgi:hypothetical protein